MTKTILEPIIVSNDVIVQFSDTVAIDKKLYITVPASYKAIVFIDEEPISRIDECNNESLFKKLNKNKSYLNKKIKIAFFRINSFPAMDWGFGMINVKNIYKSVDNLVLTNYTIVEIRLAVYKFNSLLEE